MSTKRKHFCISLLCSFHLQDYEKSIPLDYLKELDKSYKKFLDEMRYDKMVLIKNESNLNELSWQWVVGKHFSSLFS